MEDGCGQVKVNGVRVDLEEIEAVLLSRCVPSYRTFSRIAVLRGQTELSIPRGRVVTARSSDSYHTTPEC